MTTLSDARAALTALILVVAALSLYAGPATAQTGTADTTNQGAVSRADSAAAVDETGAVQEPTGAAETEAVQEPTGADEAVAPTSGFSVLRAYICKGIEQSEPTEAGKSFVPMADGVLRLCTFSEIGGPARQDTVVHVWYWGDREMARVPLGVKGPRWRTWSTKQILDEWRGEWHVEIVDTAGVLLSRLDFSVE